MTIPLKKTGPLSIATFGEAEFVQANLPLYRAYADARANGAAAAVAWEMTFGASVSAEPNDLSRIIDQIERTGCYQYNFERSRAAIPLFDLWGPRDAIEALGEMIRDPAAPQGVRLGAYRELQKVLARMDRDEAKRMPASVSAVIERAKAGSGNG